MRELDLPRLGHAPAADQSDDMRHHIDESAVLLPNLAEQLRFILGDEFQSIEVISELVELAKRGIQHPGRPGKAAARRDAIELVGRIVLHLAIGRDLALQLDQLIGLVVDAAQDAEPDGPQHDQETHDRQKCDQELGLHARRNARDQPTSRFLMLFGLVQEAKEITPELLRVEAHSKVLHAQNTTRVDERGEERVVDVAARRFRHEDAIAAFTSRMPSGCRSGTPSRRDWRRSSARTPSAPPACRAPGRR